MKLDEQQPMILNIKIGIKEQYVTLVFLVDTNLTKETPIGNLSFRISFDDTRFVLASHRRVENGWTTIHSWYNYVPENMGERDTVLGSPFVDSDRATVYYSDSPLMIPPNTRKDPGDKEDGVDKKDDDYLIQLFDQLFLKE